LTVTAEGHRREWQKLRRARRILVLGSPGSGKTHVTLGLSRALGIAAVHLDAHFWRPGWVSTPEPEWTARVSALAAEPAWVMDGTYERSLALRLPRAEAIVLINENRLACLWRVFTRRFFTDQATRPDAPPGQTLDRAFLRYILRYPWKTAPVVSAELRAHGSHAQCVTLDGGRDVRRFLRDLEAPFPPVTDTRHAAGE